MSMQGAEIRECINARRSLQGVAISNDEYHAHPAISSSKVKDYISDTWLYWWKHCSGQCQPETKDHFDFGTAVHETLLVDESESSVVLIPKEVLAKNGARSGNAWKEWSAEHSGKTLLKLADYEAVMKCVENVRKHPLAGQLMAMKGLNERGFFAVDELLGLQLRCKPDRLCGRVVVDLKTAVDCKAKKWVYQARDYGYHYQEYFYKRVLGLCGIDIEEFVFVVVNSSPPYRVEAYQLDEEFGSYAAIDVEQALAELSQCGPNWAPAPSTAITVLSPPASMRYERQYDQ